MDGALDRVDELPDVVGLGEEHRRCGEYRSGDSSKIMPRAKHQRQRWELGAQTSKHVGAWDARQREVEVRRAERAAVRLELREGLVPAPPLLKRKAEATEKGSVARSRTKRPCASKRG